MSSIPRDEAYVIAFWVETLLYGVQIVVYILYLWNTLNRGSRRLDVPLFLTATVMLILGAINNIVALQRVLVAFWGHTGMTPADFFNNTRVASNFVESVSWVLQVSLGDAFLTYRCWAIYGKRWWALVPPATVALGTFCMGVMLQVEYGRVHPIATNYERTVSLYRWEASMLVLTVALNISLTLAIAGKIWWQYRQIRIALYQRKQPQYIRIMWLIVESGMLVAISQTLVLILAAIDSPGYQVVVHAVGPIIGIVFTGIIVRVQMASEDRDPLNTTTAGRISFGRTADTSEEGGSSGLQNRLDLLKPRTAHSIESSTMLEMKPHDSMHSRPHAQEIDFTPAP